MEGKKTVLSWVDGAGQSKVAEDEPMKDAEIISCGKGDQVVKVIEILDSMASGAEANTKDEGSKGVADKISNKDQVSLDPSQDPMEPLSPSPTLCDVEMHDLDGPAAPAKHRAPLALPAKISLAPALFDAARRNATALHASQHPFAQSARERAETGVAKFLQDLDLAAYDEVVELEIPLCSCGTSTVARVGCILVDDYLDLEKLGAEDVAAFTANRALHSCVKEAWHFLRDLEPGTAFVVVKSGSRWISLVRQSDDSMCCDMVYGDFAEESSLDLATYLSLAVIEPVGDDETLETLPVSVPPAEEDDAEDSFKTRLQRPLSKLEIPTRCHSEYEPPRHYVERASEYTFTLDPTFFVQPEQALEQHLDAYAGYLPGWLPHTRREETIMTVAALKNELYHSLHRVATAVSLLSGIETHIYPGSNAIFFSRNKGFEYYRTANPESSAYEPVTPDLVILVGEGSAIINELRSRVNNSEPSSASSSGNASMQDADGVLITVAMLRQNHGASAVAYTNGIDWIFFRAEGPSVKSPSTFSVSPLYRHDQTSPSIPWLVASLLLPFAAPENIIQWIDGLNIKKNDETLRYDRFEPSKRTTTPVPAPSDADPSHETDVGLVLSVELGEIIGKGHSSIAYRLKAPYQGYVIKYPQSGCQNRLRNEIDAYEKTAPSIPGSADLFVPFHGAFKAAGDGKDKIVLLMNYAGVALADDPAGIPLHMVKDLYTRLHGAGFVHRSPAIRNVVYDRRTYALRLIDLERLEDVGCTDDSLEREMRKVTDTDESYGYFAIEQHLKTEEERLIHHEEITPKKSFWDTTVEAF